VSSLSDAHLSTVPSVRTTCHTIWTLNRPSIILSDDVHFRPDPPQVREVSVWLASIRTTQQPVRMPFCTRPASDSFQVLIKGRSINRPDNVVSRPDVSRLKARITIQIHPSGRQTALVRTSVHQIRKLPIRLQPSGQLHIMVRTRAHQIWKLRVEDQPSGRSSPMVRTC
jgi:hypothetical protein